MGGEEMMTVEKLLEALKPYITQGNCFTTAVRDILIHYKNAGGQKEMAQQILMQLKQDNPENAIIQDGVDDILDMVTGWCGPDRRVW